MDEMDEKEMMDLFGDKTDIPEVIVEDIETPAEQQEIILDETPTNLPLESLSSSTLANISLRDFAAIMLVRPVSDKEWLNDMIKQAKSEI